MEAVSIRRITALSLILFMILLASCSAPAEPKASAAVSQKDLALQSVTPIIWKAFASSPNGNLKLGMSCDEVLSILGQPLCIGDSGSWCYNDGTVVSFNDSGVSAIMLSDKSDWVLYNGIAIGSSKQEVASALNIDDYSSIGFMATFYMDADLNKTDFSSDESRASLNIDFLNGKISNIYFSALPSPTLSCASVLDIFDMSTSEPNSAGGVDVSVSFENTSDKIIKYIYFTVVPYNAVDDAVYSEIGGKSASTLKITGPISQDDSEVSYTSENVWYNSTVTRAQIESVNIEYMDGTELYMKVPIETH